MGFFPYFIICQRPRCPDADEKISLDMPEYKTERKE
jgi:hypothetical protein